MYLDQTLEYPQMYMHYPGLWAYFWKLADYDMFHLSVTGWVVIGLALILIMLMLKGRDVSDRTWISIAFLTSFFPVYFLPAMHERYSLVAELIAVVYMIIYPKRSWISLSILVAISYTVYQPIFMDRFPEIERPAVIMAYILIALIILTVRDVIMDNGENIWKKASEKPIGLTSAEKSLLDLADRYGSYLIVAVVSAIFAFASLKALPFGHPLYLPTSVAYENVTKTALRTVYEKIPEIRLFNIFFVLIAAFIWTHISDYVLGNRKRGLNNISTAFFAGFIFNPFIFIYPVLEKTPDALCLIFTGIGTIIYIRTINKKNYCLLLSALFYGISSALSPAYLLFNLAVIVFFHIHKGKKECSPPRAVTVSILSVVFALISPIIGLLNGSLIDYYPAFLTNLTLQGAVVFPATVLLLILCRKDIHFLPAALLFYFAALFDYGKYIWSIRVIHYVNIPIMGILAVLSVIIYLFTLYRHRSSAGHIADP